MPRPLHEHPVFKDVKRRPLPEWVKRPKEPYAFRHFLEDHLAAPKNTDMVLNRLNMFRRIAQAEQGQEIHYSNSTFSQNHRFFFALMEFGFLEPVMQARNRIHFWRTDRFHDPELVSWIQSAHQAALAEEIEAKSATDDPNTVRIVKGKGGRRVVLFPNNAPRLGSAVLEVIPTPAKYLSGGGTNSCTSRNA